MPTSTQSAVQVTLSFEASSPSQAAAVDAARLGRLMDRTDQIEAIRRVQAHVTEARVFRWGVL